MKRTYEVLVDFGEFFLVAGRTKSKVRAVGMAKAAVVRYGRRVLVRG